MAIAFVGVASTNAVAATATATISVTATVIATCNVTGGTLAFGSYDVLSATPKDASLAITASCAKGTTATIGLDLGLHASGAIRRMADSTDQHMTYELYSDAGRTTVWGNSGTDLVTYTATTYAPNNFTVYGRIPALQNIATNTYSDSITVTVTF